jgi:lipid II:glycine glycyltransferase (peptidoglycan interpeptide bridge formation enzyme)
MFITEKKYSRIKIINIFFAEEPETENIPDCDVIIYHTYKNWGDVEGFDRIQYPTTTIDLSQDLDEIWRKFHRQHKRHIRRAMQNGTTVSASDNFEEFHGIYKKFLKQKNYADPSGLNIPSLKFMEKYCTLFIAENHGEFLAGNLYFHDKDNALLAYGAYLISENTINKNKLSTDASCYLQWEAMKYFKNLNVTRYDLGGLDSDEMDIHYQMPPLNYYKLSFGGDVITQYEYRKFNTHLKKLLFRSWSFFTNLQLMWTRFMNNSTK